MPVSGEKSNHLYIYSVIRKDLEMPAGKLSAQAGHAYTDAFVDACEKEPELAYQYRNGINGGSKVTLEAKNQNALVRAYNEAKQAGIPCSIIVDQEHILPPHFDGNPIITALGIGPCTKDQVRHITKRFQCVK